MKKREISIALLLGFLVTCLPAPVSFAAASPATSSNIARRNYSARSDNYNNYYEKTLRWVEAEWSNLVETSTGYLRVEYISGNTMTIESYDKNFNYLSSRTDVAVELEQFVDFYASDSGYFLLFSGTNSQEDDTKEVVRLVKYDTNWNYLEHVSILGANTIGGVGHADMAESGGNLLIHTEHTMYASKDDNLNHQANMHFTIAMGDLEVISSSYAVGPIGYGYVSHSFHQFIDVSSDGFIATADHGDAYPRSLPIFSWPVDHKIGVNFGDPTDTYPSLVEVLPMYDINDYNTTGVRMGGLEVGSNKVIVVGSSVTQDQNLANNPDFNVFVGTVPRTNFTSGAEDITYVTDYDGSVYASNPFIVEVTEDKFVVLWNEFNNTAKSYDTLCWVTLNGSGDVISNISRGTGVLSEVQPIVTTTGEIAWYTTLSSVPTFYTLNLTTGEVDSHLDEVVIPVSSITMDRALLTLAEGAQGSVEYTISPSNATDQSVVWSSNNVKVATVSAQGVITAVSEGDTLISATTNDGNITASCAVKVTGDTVDVESVALDYSALSMIIDDVISLNATVLPENATDPSLSWTTSDPTIATVSDLGKVTAVSPGIATITVTTNDGDKKAICNVSVTGDSVFNIYFNANGGYVSPSIASTGANGTLSTLPTAVWGDYVFLGWYTSSVGGVQITTDYIFSNDQTVYAQWQGVVTPPEEEDEDEDFFAPVVDLPVVNQWYDTKFSDISPYHWYFDSIKFAHQYGLMNGTTSTSFSPGGTTERGMIVTMLHNMMGKPQAYSNQFTDVSQSAYYATAVAWASQNGITDGVSHQTFAPTNPMTREQLVVMLYSLEEKFIGTPVYGSNSYYFKDTEDISSWALEATQWAASNRFVTGRTSGDFDPQDWVSRAEVAQILENFLLR